MRWSSRNHFYAHVFLVCALVSSPIASCRGAYAAESNYVKAKGLSPGHVLWLRSEPTGSSKRIGFLPYSARHIQNFGCERANSRHWCQVIYRGTRGWALKRYLTDDRDRRA